MGSKGSFVLLGLLLILCVLCHSGHSLECYSCLNPSGRCTTTTNCTQNLDACLYAKADTRIYYQCWQFANCNYNDIVKQLGGKELKYDCCQKNLCNRSGGTSISGETFLLMTQVLAVFWNIFL
ncbi:CD59 glycoprotein [Rhinolophus ferrumequinum]|uniref:CD59 glycoprotein n=1 Tax=Rhinolophus ferrumequinum TaxID=59479 RepID=A0A671EAQ6_RHIFE|nr:CD59 glycoprotein [Rhinolophus ferrumequinum]